MVAFLKEHDTENAPLSAPKRIDNAQLRYPLLDLLNIYIFYYFIEDDLPSFQIHNNDLKILP